MLMPKPCSGGFKGVKLQVIQVELLFFVSPKYVGIKLKKVEQFDKALMLNIFIKHIQFF